MEENQQKVLEDIKNLVEEMALKNGWEEEFNFHLKIVPKIAEELLSLPRFANVDRFVVLIAAWLHDFAKISITTEEFKKENIDSINHNNHHLRGCELAKEILKNKFSEKDIEKISQCVLKHRNNEEYPAIEDEELIIAVADSVSHIKSVFYFLYHYWFPDKDVSDMVSGNLTKIDRDWNDILVIPEAAELCRKEYEVLKELLLSYSKD